MIQDLFRSYVRYGECVQPLYLVVLVDVCDESVVLAAHARAKFTRITSYGISYRLSSWPAPRITA